FGQVLVVPASPEPASAAAGHAPGTSPAAAGEGPGASPAAAPGARPAPAPGARPAGDAPARLSVRQIHLLAAGSGGGTGQRRKGAAS
ncbi:unnamed protein product, partial [Urochloa humidicola]